jgi:hypothetical protein
MLKPAKRRRRWALEEVEYFGRCFECGLSYRQIAAEAGVSRCAIASLLWRHGYVRESF